jgi:hypothetical protein
LEVDNMALLQECNERHNIDFWGLIRLRKKLKIKELTWEVIGFTSAREAL